MTGSTLAAEIRLQAVTGGVSLTIALATAYVTIQANMDGLWAKRHKGKRINKGLEKPKSQICELLTHDFGFLMPWGAEQLPSATKILILLNLFCQVEKNE